MTDSKPSVELKPCPFCAYDLCRVEEGVREFWVECPADDYTDDDDFVERGCGITGPLADTYDGAIAEWNERLFPHDGPTLAALEPAQPDPVGYALAIEQAWLATRDVITSQDWTDCDGDVFCDTIEAAIRALTPPADRLAVVLAMPEVREALAAAWCNGRDAASTAAWNAKPLHMLHMEAIGRLTPPDALVQP